MRARAAVAVLFWMAAACGASAQAEGAARGALCPADLEGLRVSATPIPEGGALVLTAARGEVQDLRDRMHALEDAHRALRGESQGEPREGASLVQRASAIRVVEIPRGVRVEVRADDASRVEALRAELREDAGLLNLGVCPVGLALEGDRT